MLIKSVLLWSCTLLLFVVVVSFVWQPSSACCFWGSFYRHKLDSSTLSVQFPLNWSISRWRDSPKLLIQCYWLTCSQVLVTPWHLCSLLLIPPCRCASVWMCIYVQQCPAPWNSTSQTPPSSPKGRLHAQSPLRALCPPSVPGPLRNLLLSR